ncbi:hypothetical protein EV360DRAFT_85494 [Lentinula raphanica]|nr:hypothetical protein EV360DRAFT_85494 [Lentinula raphanica]
MFFYPLKHQLAILFASLFIFGSISVTSSAAIPASEVSSNGLVRACPPPEISTIVSFPADDIPDAYPLILDPKDVVVLQGLLLEKIATDIKYLLNKPELSTIKGENLGLAEGSQLRLYRKPSDSRRYILPYSVKVGDKEYNGMTLQMWNVDKDGKSVTPKARLFRKAYIKNNKDLSTLETQQLLELASRAKFVIITFTGETSKSDSMTPLKLQDLYAGMLAMLRAFSDLIVADIKQTFAPGLEDLLDEDVRFDNLPTVLQSVKRYAIPYGLNHSKPGYSGGQLEVLRQERKERKGKKVKDSGGQVRRFKNPLDGEGSVHINKEVEQFLLPIIQTSARPTKSSSLRLTIQNIQFCLSKMFGPYWNQPAIFRLAPYPRTALPPSRRTLVMLAVARNVDAKKSSEEEVEKKVKEYDDNYKRSIEKTLRAGAYGESSFDWGTDFRNVPNIINP